MMEKRGKREINQRMTNENGLTLIELLAVLVILGILAAIAIPLVGKVIDDQRKNAYVANALVMKEAADLLLQKKSFDEEIVTKISYKELVEEGYLEKIKDPDNRGVWETTNQSYVKVTDHQVEAVCLYGDKRKLCGKSDEPISFEGLSKNQVEFQ